MSKIACEKIAAALKKSWAKVKAGGRKAL